MITLGWISLVCFLLLVLKYPLRKLGLTKLNQALMKCHEGASLGLFLCGGAQLILGFVRYRKTRLLSVIGGSIAYALDVVIIAACHMTKNPVKKLRDHRTLSLLSFLAVAAHILCSVLTRGTESSP